MQITALVHPGFTIGAIDRRVFGSFIEHLGRGVYEGIYEPGHPTADSDGFRGDVLNLVAELGVTVVRYPGGNFVSGYRWEDGVGPREKRPVRLDAAWHSIETNQIGLNEFMDWAARAGVEPLMAVNLGTRGVQDALDLLEYSNFTGGTALSDLRVQHGVPQPHGITLWCLGNEVDGPWQLGHKGAEEYGRLARETAAAMRQIDPGLQLVVCGSSHSHMPTFGEWESTVLEQCYDEVDFVSLHQYYWEGEDAKGFIAAGVDLDAFIRGVIATADAVGAKLHSPKKIMLSLDEWNIWYPQPPVVEGVERPWSEHPRLLEDVYTVLDAVTLGGLLITILRHSDRLKMACLAQLVNVIAPIRSEPGGPVWRQTTFYPFSLTARLARGVTLQMPVSGETISTSKFGEIAAVDSVATWDEETGRLSVLLLNRSFDDEANLEVDVSAFSPAGDITIVESALMHDDDPWATNTMDAPTRVLPKPVAARVENGILKVALPAISWAAVSLVVPARVDPS
ncbi:arabinosylfuranosidase ArfA [Subtercola endophyticus]|uniref:arabinosylfuranosidase ArfA n=1 Tax=Subtercola endophyticus TaxID=2895559 RepID=UPI001E6449E3|nr:alpha-N-arabinofuranosidase [Subtercola endophyticus]UFS59935.1 alpha-N-arabinofuranosidase [Subtercola endophyticus]